MSLLKHYEALLHAFGPHEREDIETRWREICEEQIALALIQLFYHLIGATVSFESTVGGKRVGAEVTIINVEMDELDGESILWIDDTQGTRTAVSFNRLTITLPEISA